MGILRNKADAGEKEAAYSKGGGRGVVSGRGLGAGGWAEQVVGVIKKGAGMIPIIIIITIIFITIIINAIIVIAIIFIELLLLQLLNYFNRDYYYRHFTITIIPTICIIISTIFKVQLLSPVWNGDSVSDRQCARLHYGGRFKCEH